MHDARALRLGCALAGRDSGRLGMRHGAGQAPGRARRAPGTRDPRSWAPRPPRYGYKSAGPRRAQGLRGMGARLGACVLKQEPKKRFGPTDPSVFKQPLCHPRLATFPVRRLHLGEERAKKIRLTPSGSPGRPIRGYQACFMGHTLPEQACGLEFECHRGRGSTHVWKRHPLRTRRMTSVGPECQHIFLIHLFPSDLPGGVGQPPQGHSQDGSRTYLPLPQPSLYLSTLLPYMVPK